MNKMKKFEQFINESYKTLTLFHGTCESNGKFLIENGWKPINRNFGSNMGNPNYLYLSSKPEDALWFAEEKGCDTVVQIINIPIDYLKPDPEDEAGFTMKELLDRMKINILPSKFILIKPLDNSHFKLYSI